MKAIFVDEANIHHIGLGMGIRQISYPALYDILVNIGTKGLELAHKPVITMHPKRAALFGKMLGNLGFELIPVDSAGGRDDAMIKERIKGLNLDLITEIVIASADSDYDEGGMLRKLVGRGITVHFAAARVRDRVTKHPMIGELLEYRFSQGEFQFFDLASYRGQLSLQEARRRRTYPPPDGLRLILETKDENLYPQIIAEISRIAHGSSGVSMRIETQDELATEER